jgi:hypothetical protein
MAKRLPFVCLSGNPVADVPRNYSRACQMLYRVSITNWQMITGYWQPTERELFS